MRFGPAIIRSCVPTECGALAGARRRRFEQLRETGNVYGVCYEEFAARLVVPPLFTGTPDCCIAREILKEGLVIAIKL